MASGSNVSRSFAFLVVVLELVVFCWRILIAAGVIAVASNHLLARNDVCDKLEP